MPSEPSSQDEPYLNNRCRCSHIRFRHCYDTVDGPCSKPGCVCEAYVPVTVETVELPEPEERLVKALRDLGEQGERDTVKMLRQWAARATARQDIFPEPEPFEIPSIQAGCAVLHKDAKGNTVPCPDEAPAERRCNGCGHHEGEGCGCPEHEYVSPEHCDRCAGDQAEPKEPPCGACGQFAESWFDRSICAEPCGSMHYRCSNCGAVVGHCPLETPPQPERRPPLTVQYSVAGGHPYEVSIPGDASVTAEDGALIIKHPSAQILAITRVAPMEG